MTHWERGVPTVLSSDALPRETLRPFLKARASAFADFPLTAVDINSPDTGHLDINLMRHCHHAITANSTFSWWGAWLIPHDDAVVVSPEKWFASSGRAEGLQPSRWILA